MDNNSNEESYYYIHLISTQNVFNYYVNNFSFYHTNHIHKNKFVIFVAKDTYSLVSSDGLGSLTSSADSVDLCVESLDIANLDFIIADNSNISNPIINYEAGNFHVSTGSQNVCTDMSNTTGKIN